jgi:hypothetical protein
MGGGLQRETAGVSRDQPAAAVPASCEEQVVGGVDCFLHVGGGAQGWVHLDQVHGPQATCLVHLLHQVYPLAQSQTPSNCKKNKLFDI